MTRLSRALLFSAAIHGLLLVAGAPTAEPPRALRSAEPAVVLQAWLKALPADRALLPQGASTAHSGNKTGGRSGVGASREAQLVGPSPAAMVPMNEAVGAISPFPPVERSPGGGAPGLPRPVDEAVPPAPTVTRAAVLSSAGDAIAPPDPEDLRSYRLRLAAVAARFKRYPALARERGWEGVVVVRVRHRIGPAVLETSLAHSSGYPALDAAALDMVRQAVNEAALPVRLQGRLLELELPIDYRLE